MLTIENVTVTYPDGERTLTALDNVSFSAQPGELTFIVGESGSGKSTLLSAAAGLITPDSGTVLVSGSPVSDKIRLEKIGMIFQQANLIKALNVREQLLVTDHMRGISPRADRAEELLAVVGLEGLGGRRMEQLSGGQRQRVGIARALMGEPELVLADEPTAALDSERSHEIVTLLRTLVEQNNIACAFVTHDRSLISERDRVVEVKDGRIVDLAGVLSELVEDNLSVVAARAGDDAGAVIPAAHGIRLAGGGAVGLDGPRKIIPNVFGAGDPLCHGVEDAKAEWAAGILIHRQFGDSPPITRTADGDGLAVEIRGGPGLLREPPVGGSFREGSAGTVCTAVGTDAEVTRVDVTTKVEGCGSAGVGEEHAATPRATRALNAPATQARYDISGPFRVLPRA